MSVLKFNSPAETWEDALPFGNGTLGAMAFANTYHERIIVNHEALFLPMDGRAALPDLSDAMKEASARVLNGQSDRASEVFLQAARSRGLNAPSNGSDRYYPDAFHPAFDIHIHIETGDAEEELYQSELDLSNGKTHTQWQGDHSVYHREAFVSKADGMGVIRLYREDHAPIKAFIALTATPPLNERGHWLTQTFLGESATQFSDGCLEYLCSYKRGGGYRGIARVSGGDGKTVNGGYEIISPEILVCFTVRINLDIPTKIAARTNDFESLFKRHTTEWAQNCSLSALRLNTTPENAEIERMYAFGIYMALSCYGKLPPNAQGLWNGDWSAGVLADYVLNIELEMAAWPLMPLGLFAQARVLFDMADAFMDDWRNNAQKIYGARGLLVACRSSNNGLLLHFSRAYPHVFWVAGGAWFGQIFFDYYLYTQDENFLRNRAFPFMKESALFYTDYLQEDGSGRLILAPSLSPENTPSNADGMAAVNATMDISAIRELMQNLVKAASILHETPDPVWKDIVQRLPEYLYNADGSMKEWAWSTLDDQNEHRHLSHLYCAYPGMEAVECGGRLENGCVDALKNRIERGMRVFCGWSVGHAANIAARLGDGNTALTMLNALIHEYVKRNYLTTLDSQANHFQIDANLAFTAAVCEMLAFSLPGTVKLLPALPDTWDDGEITELFLRGNVRLHSLSWKKCGNEICATFSSHTSCPLRVIYPDGKNSVSEQKIWLESNVLYRFCVSNE